VDSRSGAVIEALAVNAVVAIIALSARVVRPSAAWGGLIVGFLIYLGAGRGGYALLLAFFVAGVVLTKLGYRRKAARGLAEPNEGRRGSAHAFANAGTAALLSTGILLWPGARVPLLVALAGSFAAALADTAGSEIGQLWGRRTISPITFRPVPPGTEGAVSFEGTLAGVLAAAFIGGTGLVAGLYGPAGFFAASLGGVAGSMAESAVGSVSALRRAGHMVFNVGNTIVGAIVAWLLHAGFAG
jgi:uncharacterized protein (TIGR00297 family)